MQFLVLLICIAFDIPLFRTLTCVLYLVYNYYCPSSDINMEPIHHQTKKNYLTNFVWAYVVWTGIKWRQGYGDLVRTLYDV